jgi:hypothetical protein
MRTIGASRRWSHPMPWRRRRRLVFVVRWIFPLNLGLLLFVAPLISPVAANPIIPQPAVALVTQAAGIAIALMGTRKFRNVAASAALVACALRCAAFLIEGFGHTPRLPFWRTLYGGFVWFVLAEFVILLFIAIEDSDPRWHLNQPAPEAP